MKDLRETLIAMDTVYKKVFDDTINARQRSVLADRLTMKFTSNKAVENYAWLTDRYGVRKWIGERETMDGFAETYLLSNELYEGTVKTKIVDIEDGLVIGNQASRVRGLANAYNRRQDLAVINLIKSGFIDTRTVDGKPVFAADHPYWSQSLVQGGNTETYKMNPDGTFSNLTNEVFSEDALWAAKEKFTLMKDHFGEPADVMPNLLVVGPRLERAAKRILNTSSIARVIDDGTGNAAGVAVEANDAQGMFDLIVEPRFGTSMKWMLFDTSDADQRPFILQERVKPQMQAVGSFATLAEGQIPEHVFNKDEIVHGVRGRFGVGYGLSFRAYGSTAGEGPTFA